MMSLEQARNSVIQQIEQACEVAQRQSNEVKLLAVSKTHPADILREMYQTGQRAFGENYLQEALDKIKALNDLDIEWHFIGHVQRNKTKQLAEQFAWVHGVDRFIIAERLSNQRTIEQEPINICLQVNIDAQESKDGCAVSEVEDLVAQMSILPRLRLRGLM